MTSEEIKSLKKKGDNVRIAQMANVSTQTVWRVLNGKENVLPITQSIVLSIAQQVARQNQRQITSGQVAQDLGLEKY